MPTGAILLKNKMLSLVGRHELGNTVKQGFPLKLPEEAGAQE